MCISPVVSRKLCFLVSSIPTDSYSVSAAASVKIPESQGVEFDGDIPFRTHSLYIVHFWTLVIFLTYCRKKILQRLLRKTLIYDYRKKWN